MKRWRWFVGQVARLRRSIVGTLRRGQADEHVASADDPRSGPPDHWVERVRQGAPGLLEPSFRQRNGSTEQPVAERVPPPAAERAPQPEPVEETVRDNVPPKPLAAPRRREATVARLRNVLRRKPPGLTPPSIAPPAAGADELPREPTRRESEHESLTSEAPPLRQRSLDKPDGDQPDRSSPLPAVVELEPPVQLKAARPEAATNPGPLSKTRTSSHVSSDSLRQAEPAVGKVGTEHVWKRAAPAPTRESEAKSIVQPAAPRPVPQQEPNAELRLTPSRAEPLTDVEVHPWPELPPPLDHDDSHVEAALRAAEHQRRLDREQTRL